MHNHLLTPLQTQSMFKRTLNFTPVPIISAPQVITFLPRLDKHKITDESLTSFLSNHIVQPFVTKVEVLCKITPENEDAIMIMFQILFLPCRFVTKIKLNNIKMGDQCIGFLVRCNWRLITKLQIANNCIGPEGMKYLAQGQWDFLKQVFLNSNPIRNSGLQYLAQLKAPHLTQLSVEMTKITDDGIKSLIKGKWPYLKTLICPVYKTSSVLALLKLSSKAEHIIKSCLKQLELTEHERFLQNTMYGQEINKKYCICKNILIKASPNLKQMIMYSDCYRESRLYNIKKGEGSPTTTFSLWTKVVKQIVQ